LLDQQRGFDVRAGETNPFVAKLDPETRLYSGSTYDLGFDHIMDVLRQDVAAGRIRPDQLNKVSMEQAVRRTYEFDQDMAKKMRETQAKVTEGMPVYKEYPEGYKWVELAAPDSNKFEESIRHLESNPKEWQKAVEEFRENRQKNLESALKYEGDTMGHCVGGYCPDVVEGKSRIFSLRDAKGEPHVTIEVQPVEKHPIGYSMSGGKKFPDDFRYESGSIAPEQHQQIYQRAKQLFNPEFASDLSSHRMDVFQQAADEVIGKPAEQIIQITQSAIVRLKRSIQPWVVSTVT
jgi:hypothetical protein